MPTKPRRKKKSAKLTVAKKEAPKDIDTILQDHDLILAALRKAARDAIILHRKMGLPVVMAEGGKPIWVDPNTIDIGE